MYLFFKLEIAFCLRNLLSLEKKKKKIDFILYIMLPGFK